MQSGKKLVSKEKKLIKNSSKDVIQIGDSKGIILYSNILKVLDWEVGDELELNIVGVNQITLYLEKK